MNEPERGDGHVGVEAAAACAHPRQEQKAQGRNPAGFGSLHVHATIEREGGPATPNWVRHAGSPVSSCFLGRLIRLMVRMSMSEDNQAHSSGASSGVSGAANSPAQPHRGGRGRRGGRRRRSAGDGEAGPAAEPASKTEESTRARDETHGPEGVETAGADAGVQPAGAHEMRSQGAGTVLSARPVSAMASSSAASSGASGSRQGAGADLGRSSALDNAIRRLTEIIQDLKEVLEDMEEAVDLLDMAAEQKQETERELERLHRALNQLQRSRPGERPGSGR